MRHVSFNAVEIREYNRILSDNPATSSGPPIGIGWIFLPEDTIILDVDTYESFRDSDGRRCKRELVMPSVVRQEMLREEGYSREEIAKVCRETRKIRERRNISFHHMKYDPIAERVETFRRVLSCSKIGHESDLTWSHQGTKVGNEKIKFVSEDKKLGLRGHKDSLILDS